jgi:hypothetical protein
MPKSKPKNDKPTADEKADMLLSEVKKYRRKADLNPGGMSLAVKRLCDLAERLITKNLAMYKEMNDGKN